MGIPSPSSSRHHHHNPIIVIPSSSANHSSLFIRRYPNLPIHPLYVSFFFLFRQYHPFYYKSKGISYRIIYVHFSILFQIIIVNAKKKWSGRFISCCHKTLYRVTSYSTAGTMIFQMGDNRSFRSRVCHFRITFALISTWFCNDRTSIRYASPQNISTFDIKIDSL